MSDQEVRICQSYLERFVLPNQVTELRAFGERNYVGFFDGGHLGEMARCAVDLQASCRGVYFVPNPVRPEKLAISPNKVVPGKHGMATSDADIVSRQWLLVDVDPVRPADTAANEDERTAAWNVALSVYAGMNDAGMRHPVMGFSGNGWHLCYPVDMLNDDQSRLACQSMLAGLNERYGNERAKVDVKTFNASRIWKLYGTLSRKGSGDGDRPHRASFLVSSQDGLNLLPRDGNNYAARTANNAALPALLGLWAAQAQARDRVERDFQAAGTLKRAAAYLEKIAPAISGAGGHAAAFHVACCLVEGFNLSDGDASEVIRGWNARCQPPWSDAELRHKFRDARKKATNFGHLIAEGAEFVAGLELAQPHTVTEEVEEVDATAADIRAANMSTRWAWKGWIQLGATTCLAAEPGVGKTRLAMDIAKRLWHGLPWPDGQLATFPPGTKTLWVPADNQWAEMADVPEQMGIPLEAVVLNSTKANPFSGTNLDKPDQLNDLERRILRVKPALVLIDTVGMVTDLPTYKQEDAKRVFKPFAEIAQRCNVGIVLVTHLSKGGEALGRRIIGATRQVIKLCKPEGCDENRRRMWVDKTSAIKPPPLGVTMGETGNDYDLSPPAMVDDRGQAVPESGGGKMGNLIHAVTWVQAALVPGSVLLSALLRDAAAGGKIAPSDVLKALDNIGAERYNCEKGKRWVRLPC